MALGLKIILFIVLLLIVGLGSAIWIGSAVWNRSTSQLVDRLTRTSRGETETVFSFKELDGLPAPVERYFSLVLKEGQPLIRLVRLVQTGEFRIGKSDDVWRRLEATQHFSTGSTGFVWEARIQMAPLMTVRIRDAYIDGHGSMQGKLLSLATVIDEHGKAELNAGALQRYLAEAVWFPTALLPSQGVQWSEIDDSTALATLTDFDNTVSLEFRFDETGQITGVYTPGRYREVDGRYELTPWAGYFRRYEERDGMRIPVEGNVEWQLPDGSLPYWKGRIVEIEYDFKR